MTLTDWRLTRRRGVERREFPRIPLAVPVRFATDQGQVGIGVLIDIHTKGAGLLLPLIAPDASYVWGQFLWFARDVGIQGRVAFIRETPDGCHVGVELLHLHPDSIRFISDVLMPYGLRKFKHDRRHPLAFWRAPQPNGEDGAPRRRRYLPVHVEQGPLDQWAITEERTDHGLIMLLSQRPEDGTPLRITTWGHPAIRFGRVAEAETLVFPPITLYRCVIVFEDAPVSAVDDPAADRTRSA